MATTTTPATASPPPGDQPIRCRKHPHPSPRRAGPGHPLGHRHRQRGPLATAGAPHPSAVDLLHLGQGAAYEIRPDGSTTLLRPARQHRRTDRSDYVTDRFEYSPYGIQTHHVGASDSLPLQRNTACKATKTVYSICAPVTTIPTRRFINADPIGFEGGLNWYAYAGGILCYNDPQ